jgi:hypothetical protein
MVCEDTAKRLLQALSDAGLCVCERKLIGDCHPGLLDHDDYIIDRLLTVRTRDV